MVCKEKQRKDKEKQNLKGPERKHPTALGPNKKLSITCNWKLKFLRESLSFKTRTISCSRILDHSETLTTLVERENQAPSSRFQVRTILYEGPATRTNT